MNKKQLTNLLGAGTITGFILALVLMFSNGDVQGQTAVIPATDQPGITEVVPLADYNQLAAENDQLALDLQTMQGREAQYEAQLTQANDLLAQPQTYAGGEHEEPEHEEHEHEGYDHDD